MPSKSKIIVRFTTAGLFGDEGSAGYDKELSTYEYQVQARLKLRAAYDAREWIVDVRAAQADSIQVLDAGGHALPDEVAWIGNILTRLHETWDWAVPEGILA